MKTIDDLKKKYNLKIEGNLNSAHTMVFAHGFGSDQTSWRKVKENFSDDFRIVLYDNIGGGNSDPASFSPLKYKSLDVYASDLLEIMETLDLQGAILVAHSVSSMIGLLACIQRPEIFSKLVFIGASPRYLNDEGYPGGFEQADLDALYDSMTSNYYSWVSGFSSITMRNAGKPELGQEFAGTLSEIQPDIALSVAKVIFSSDCRSELPKLTKEVLLLQSEDDFAVPDSVADYLHSNLSKSRINKIKAEGHFPHISAPEEVVQAIQSFI